MRILVVVFLTPVLLLMFTYLATAPFDIVLYTLEPEGNAKLVLHVARLVVGLIFGLWGTVWVVRKIWRGMGEQEPPK